MEKSYSKIVEESKKIARKRFKVCEAVAEYSKKTRRHFMQSDLFAA